MSLVTVRAKKLEYAFLHLGIHFAATEGEAERAAIERALNNARDWLRYAPNCWIVYTSRSPAAWQEDLLKLPGMQAHNLFICEINIKRRAGWLSNSTWDWINKPR